MERSFKREVEALRLGSGEVFRGEGILAVTKALLQAGVSYVGGYQGAPVSHLLDVMVDAEDLLGDLGVHVETCTSSIDAIRREKQLKGWVRRRKVALIEAGNPGWRDLAEDCLGS